MRLTATVSVILALTAALLLATTDLRLAESTVPGHNGKIAFEAQVREGTDVNFEIFVVNPDGTNLTNLTNSPEGEFDPAWSPDGMKIAFHVAEHSGIWVMDADGSNRQQLTEGADFDPEWSPDGARIAFGSFGDGVDGIFILELESGEISFPTENISTAMNGGPSWSPDGTKIAHSDQQIVVTNVDGSGEVEVVTDGGGAPVWSPDGARIAYTHSDIYLIHPDGSNRVNLTNSPLAEGEIAWSPDGSRMVYTAVPRFPGGQRPQLWMMNADGTNQTQFTSLESYALNPDWQPLAEDPGYAPFPLATPSPTPQPSPTPEMPAGFPAGGGPPPAGDDYTIPLALAGIGIAVSVATAFAAHRIRSSRLPARRPARVRPEEASRYE